MSFIGKKYINNNNKIIFNVLLINTILISKNRYTQIIYFNFKPYNFLLNLIINIIFYYLLILIKCRKNYVYLTLFLNPKHSFKNILGITFGAICHCFAWRVKKKGVATEG